MAAFSVLVLLLELLIGLFDVLHLEAVKLAAHAAKNFAILAKQNGLAFVAPAIRLDGNPSVLRQPLERISKRFLVHLFFSMKLCTFIC